MYNDFQTAAHVFLNNLNIKDTPEFIDKISKRLEESIISLRCEDPYTYDQLMMMSVRDRQWVFESFLDLFIIDENNIKNQLINVPFLLQEATADMYDEPLVITEDFKNYAKDKLKSGFGAAYNASKEFGKEMFMSGTSSVADLAVNALKSIGIPLSLTGILSFIKGIPFVPDSFLFRFLILYIIYFLSFPKDAVAVWTDIIDMFEAMVKTIKKGTDPIKYAFILTFKNEEECYKKAGYGNKFPSVITFIMMLTGSSSDVDNKPIDDLVNRIKSYSRSDVLRNCVLSGLLDRMQLFITAYMDCLKHSGNWNKVDVSDDKFVSLIRLNGNPGVGCSEFLNNAQDAASTFSHVKSIILRNDPAESHKWDILMNRCIIDSKNEAMKGRTNRNFGDKFSNNNFKHKELSRDL